MDPSKSSALFSICMLVISSVTPTLGCGYCGEPKKGGHHKPSTGVKVPPVTVPHLPVPPVTVPKLPVPPVLPPVLNPPSGPSGKPCPPGTPAAQPTCPINTLKLGGCVDLLGGLVHIGIGDPAVNKCCPILQGLVEAEAAVCLCTTLKLNLLDLNLYVPIALQLLISCGKTPPPGFTCTL